MSILKKLNQFFFDKSLDLACDICSKNVKVFADQDVKAASLNINLSRPPDAFMHSGRHDKNCNPIPPKISFLVPFPIELSENFSMQNQILFYL